MSSAEFTEWMAYAQIEPFGEQATQYQLAQIAAAIYNVNRDPRKTRPIKAEEFMVTYKRDEHEQDNEPASVFARLKASLAAAGALAAGAAGASGALAAEASDG